MALPTTGAISFANIQTEFGGTNPISMTEYYGDDSVTGDIPPAGHLGSVSMSEFRGSEKAFATATRVVSVVTSSGAPSFSGTIDASGGPAGQTWAVVIWRGASSSTGTYPSNAPQVGVTNLFPRATRSWGSASGYAFAACWASSISPNASQSFSWTPNQSFTGTDINGWDLWIVKGVSTLSSTISRIDSFGGGSQNTNFNTPACVIAGGASFNGTGGLGTNFDTISFGCGGDRYLPPGSQTISYDQNNVTAGVILNFGDNNAIIV